MLGVGPTQALSRFGSSSHIFIKSSEIMDVPCSDGHALGPVSASPNTKKRHSLLKGLKRLGNIFSGNSSVSAGTAEIRPDADSLQHNIFAHAISTPDFPCATPISISASPYPSSMDISQNSRLSSILRSGGTGSPPIEPHSPCSPFPMGGRGGGFFKRDSAQHLSSSNSDCPALRCNVAACSAGTPPVAISSPALRSPATKQQLPSSSPIVLASTSPFNSLSSGPGRLDRAPATQPPQQLAAASTSSLSSSALPPRLLSAPAAPAPAVVAASSPSSVPPTSAAQQPVATTPAPAPAPAPAPPTPPAPRPPTPNTTLLAINSAVPGPMKRRTWCLDDYQVVKRLYKGASASVYKATCLRSGATVALKVYFLTRVPRNVVHMIKREIELHHQLVHPNIIQLYAAFLDGDRIVLVQEYAARGDLFHLLRQMGGRMTEAQVSELVMRPFLDALAYLHGQGICHRDIKPENILYNEQWVLKVADFGVSINLNEERAVTRAGTLDYMAPEVCRCPLKAEPTDNKDDPSLAYTSAVDVWAAGVLSYELLVGFMPMMGAPHAGAGGGKPPQAGAGAGGAVIDFVATSATSQTLHFPASLSQASRSFILAALSEDPGDRPTAKELLRHPWLSA